MNTQSKWTPGSFVVSRYGNRFEIQACAKRGWARQVSVHQTLADANAVCEKLNAESLAKAGGA